jgi:hypothetical protein
MNCDLINTDYGFFSTWKKYALFKDSLMAYFAILKGCLIKKKKKNTLRKKNSFLRVHIVRDFRIFPPYQHSFLWSSTSDKLIVLLPQKASENRYLDIKEQRSSENHREKVLHSTKTSDKII